MKNNVLMVQFLSALIAMTSFSSIDAQIDDREAATQVQILDSQGAPAKNAKVFAKFHNETLGFAPTQLFDNTNDGKFSPELDKTPIKLMSNSGPDDEPQTTEIPQNTISTVIRSSEDGFVQISSDVEAGLVVSDDGTEVAFVPNVTSSPIHLRPCGKLKLKLADQGKGCTIIVTWKNCLAGSYPLLTPGADDPDWKSKMDWRIFSYFDVYTVLEDVQADVELYLPPGEVAVAAVSKEQIELMEQFDLAKLRAARPHSVFLHTAATSGIHGIKSSETTRVPLKFGMCVTGQIQSRRKRTIPDWDQSEFAKGYIRITHTDGRDARYYDKNADSMVAALSTETGKRYRIKTQSGVLTTLKTKQGKFVSYPLAEGSYNVNVYGLHGTRTAKTGRNDTVVGATVHQLVPASHSESAGNGITIASSGILDLGEVRAVNAGILPTSRSPELSGKERANDLADTPDSDISLVESKFENIDQDLQTALDDYSIDHPEVQSVVNRLRQRLKVQLNVKLQQRSAEINELATRLEDARQKLKQRSDDATRIVERQLLKLLEQQGVDHETAKSLLKKDE